MDDDVLCHYGVLGMKWGQRKNKGSISNKYHKSNTVGRKIKNVVKNRPKKVNIKKLSDDELRDKIKRLEMEKRYRDLKRDEVSAGRKLVGEILNNSAKRLGTSFLVGVGESTISKTTGINIKASKKKK